MALASVAGPTTSFGKRPSRGYLRWCTFPRHQARVTPDPVTTAYGNLPGTPKGTLTRDWTIRKGHSTHRVFQLPTAHLSMSLVVISIVVFSPKKKGG